MRAKALQGLTLLLVLAAAVVANPPDGQLFGNELPLALWAGLIGLALVAGVLSILLAGRPVAYGAAALLALPLLGPVADFTSTGFWAALAGAWAFMLHLELLSYENRRTSWAQRLDDDTGETLATYERAYTRSLTRLAGVSLVALVGLSGLYWLFQQVAPGTFELSMEARHVEGMAAFTLILIAIIAALWLLTRASSPEATPEPEEA